MTAFGKIKIVFELETSCVVEGKTAEAAVEILTARLAEELKKVKFLSLFDIKVKKAVCEVLKDDKDSKKKGEEGATPNE